MKRLHVVAIMIAVFIIFAGSIWADTIKLKDGDVIKGEVKKITEKDVTVETDSGTLIIDREEVTYIRIDRIELQKSSWGLLKGCVMASCIVGLAMFFLLIDTIS